MITAGSASTASTIRPTTRSKTAAEVAHGQAERGAQDGAEDGGQRGDDQDVPGADDDPGQHVPAERVGAEPVRARRARRCWPASCWASGLYGAIGCPKIAHTTQNSMMPAPTMKVGRVSSSRHRACARPVGAATATGPPTGAPGAERRGVAGVGA